MRRLLNDFEFLRVSAVSVIFKNILLRKKWSWATVSNVCIKCFAHPQQHCHHVISEAVRCGHHMPTTHALPCVTTVVPMSRVTQHCVTRHINALPLGDQSPSTKVVDGAVRGVGVAQRHLPGPLILLSRRAIGDPQSPDFGDAALGRNRHSTGTSLEGRC